MRQLFYYAKNDMFMPNWRYIIFAEYPQLIGCLQFVDTPVDYPQFADSSNLRIVADSKLSANHCFLIFEDTFLPQKRKCPKTRILRVFSNLDIFLFAATEYSQK